MCDKLWMVVNIYKENDVNGDNVGVNDDDDDYDYGDDIVDDDDCDDDRISTGYTERVLLSLTISPF